MAEKDVKKRVRDAMKELGISAYAIAKSCSMNERTIYQQTNGSSKLGVETIEALLRYKPELSASWILLGTGEKLLNAETRRQWDDNETIAALKLTIEKMQRTIDNQDREIEGLLERIKELKGDIATPHRSVATA